MWNPHGRVGQLPNTFWGSQQVGQLKQYFPSSTPPKAVKPSWLWRYVANGHHLDGFSGFWFYNNHTSLMPNKGLDSFLKLKCWCFLLLLAMSSAHDLVLQHGASCWFTLLCLLYTTLPINHLYVPNAQENSISKARSPSVRYVSFFIAVTVQGFGRMVCDFLCSFIFQVYRQLPLLVTVYHWSRLVIFVISWLVRKKRFLRNNGDMFHRIDEYMFWRFLE